MTMFFAKKLNKKGFTLAELLIVVAIIAVLVAIAIPIFTNALQDARIATHKANARSLKAAAVVKILKDPTLNNGTNTNTTWTATAKVDESGNLGTVTVTAGGTVSGDFGFTVTAGKSGATPKGTKADLASIDPLGSTYTLVVTETDLT